MKKTGLQLTPNTQVKQLILQLYALSRRNILLRYKYSILGFFWGFLKPLLYLLVFIVIFSQALQGVEHQVLYITSGLIVWFFFANACNQSLNSLVQSSGLMKSLAIKPILFPIAEVGSEVFNFKLALLVFIPLMTLFGLKIKIALFTLPVLTLLLACFSLGISLVLSAMQVYYRDVGILWNTLQPAFFYLTPVAYTEQFIPERFRFIVQLNPVYPFIKAFRSVLYKGMIPDSGLWIQCMLLSAGSYLIGMMVFNRLKNQFITAI